MIFTPSKEEDCPICLDSMDDPVYMYPCGHSGDGSCIRLWLQHCDAKNVTCLICREQVRSIYHQKKYKSPIVFMDELLKKIRHCHIHIDFGEKDIIFKVHSPKHLRIQLSIILINLSIHGYLVHGAKEQIMRTILSHEVKLGEQNPMPFGYYILR
jgi:hypothetical protein